MEWPLHCHVCGLSDVQGTSFFRDRENDCGDWSDELNCTETVTRVLHNDNTATYFLLNLSCLSCQ